jgi:drug/metabolite transporter (DMT)-like permease
MLVAMLFFIGSDTLLKVVSTAYPPSQIMAVRGVFAACFALALVAMWGEGSRLRSSVSPVVALRSACEAMVAFLFLTSLAKLPIATITTIGQAAPIILTLMVVILGIERVGPRRWSAIVVGFIGVLLVIRPSPAGFDAYALVALASAVLVAARDLVTRFISREVPSTVVTLSTTVTVALAGFLFGLGEDWQPVFRVETLYLVASALLVTLGSLAIVIAFRDTDLSVVGPFRYSIIVLAIVAGYMVFGELPDGMAVAGIVLIVGSGIYTIHREQARRREALREAALTESREAV